MRRLLIVLVLLSLAGCASRAPAPVADSQVPAREAAKAVKPAGAADKFYAVKKGDTLYSIALDHGLEVRELAAWNNIENPSRIRVGQQLRVSAPGAEPVAPAGGAEVKPIAAGGPVTVRSLDDKPASAAVSPASSVPADTATLKRGPKGGKLPYSEDNLARLKSQESAPPVASPAAPPAASPEKPVEKPQEKPAAAATDVEWAWPSSGKLLRQFGEGGNGAELSKGIDIAGKIGDPVQAAAAGKVIHVGSEIRGLGNFVVVKHSPEHLSVYGHNSRILVKQDQMVTRGQKIAELGNSDADQPKLHFEVRLQGKPVDPLKYLPAR